MSFPEVVFELVADEGCPFYRLGDRFRLGGKALLLRQNHEKTFISTTVIKLPPGKSACRILIEDISRILIRYKSIDQLPGYTLQCGGCTGKIRLAYRSQGRPAPPAETGGLEIDREVIESLLGNFSFFQALKDEDIKNVVPYLQLKKFNPGEVILRKGEPGRNLYVIVSGLVEVLGREDVSIVFMGRGEVFGEMSLLSGDPVTATIRVVEPAKTLAIRGEDFKHLLKTHGSLQTYFTRLLSRRLAEINVIRSEEFGSGMMGHLSEMSTAELFQTFHVNEKDGTLKLSLPRGKASVTFRSGEVVRAKYEKREGTEAFYAVLAEKEGRFQFKNGLSPEDADGAPVGDFTWMLMEGLRRIDESR